MSIRVHDGPYPEVRVELFDGRIDLDLTGTAQARFLADAAQERSQPVGVRRVTKEEPQE